MDSTVAEKIYTQEEHDAKVAEAIKAWMTIHDIGLVKGAVLVTASALICIGVVGITETVVEHVKIKRTLRKCFKNLKSKT